MSGPTVADRIFKIVADQLGESAFTADRLTLNAAASIVGDLGADSLDLVELAMAIEEEYGIPIPDDLDLEKAWPTVGDVITYVEKATAGR